MFCIKRKTDLQVLKQIFYQWETGYLLSSGKEFHDSVLVNWSHDKGEHSNFVHLLKQKKIEFKKKCNESLNLSEYSGFTVLNVVAYCQQNSR